jgi:hypothetical protein
MSKIATSFLNDIGQRLLKLEGAMRQRPKMSAAVDVYQRMLVDPVTMLTRTLEPLISGRHIVAPPEAVRDGCPIPETAGKIERAISPLSLGRPDLTTHPKPVRHFQQTPADLAGRSDAARPEIPVPPNQPTPSEDPSTAKYSVRSAPRSSVPAAGFAPSLTSAVHVPSDAYPTGPAASLKTAGLMPERAVPPEAQPSGPTGFRPPQRGAKDASDFESDFDIPVASLSTAQHDAEFAPRRSSLLPIDGLRLTREPSRLRALLQADVVQPPKATAESAVAAGDTPYVQPSWLPSIRPGGETAAERTAAPSGESQRALLQTISDRIADELELALLRFYGTSGG